MEPLDAQSLCDIYRRVCFAQPSAEQANTLAAIATSLATHDDILSYLAALGEALRAKDGDGTFSFWAVKTAAYLNGYNILVHDGLFACAKSGYTRAAIRAIIEEENGLPPDGWRGA